MRTWNFRLCLSLTICFFAGLDVDTAHHNVWNLILDTEGGFKMPWIKQWKFHLWFNLLWCPCFFCHFSIYHFHLCPKNMIITNHKCLFIEFETSSIHPLSIHGGGAYFQLSLSERSYTLDRSPVHHGIIQDKQPCVYTCAKWQFSVTN